jgi:hypothetical protein
MKAITRTLSGVMQACCERRLAASPTFQLRDEKIGESKMPRKRARKTNKRAVLEPRKSDRRYVRRNKHGEFKKEVNVGRSLSVDRRRAAKTKVKKGQGDRGDT